MAPHATGTAKSTSKQTFADVVKADKAYAKYTRMLGMGIPEAAVKQKMTMDGVAIPKPKEATAAARSTAPQKPKTFSSWIHSDEQLSKYR